MDENVKNFKKTCEKEQISLLIELMEEMNKNCAAVLKELKTIKALVNFIKSRA